MNPANTSFELTPFAYGFMARCASDGLTPAQAARQIEKMAEALDDRTMAELRGGLEKAAELWYGLEKSAGIGSFFASLLRGGLKAAPKAAPAVVRGLEEAAPSVARGLGSVAEGVARAAPSVATAAGSPIPGAVASAPSRFGRALTPVLGRGAAGLGTGLTTYLSDPTNSNSWADPTRIGTSVAAAGLGAVSPRAGLRMVTGQGVGGALGLGVESARWAAGHGPPSGQLTQAAMNIGGGVGAASGLIRPGRWNVSPKAPGSLLRTGLGYGAMTAAVPAIGAGAQFYHDAQNTMNEYGTLRYANTAGKHATQIEALLKTDPAAAAAYIKQEGLPGSTPEQTLATMRQMQAKGQETGKEIGTTVLDATLNSPEGQQKLMGRMQTMLNSPEAAKFEIAPGVTLGQAREFLSSPTVKQMLASGGQPGATAMNFIERAADSVLGMFLGPQTLAGMAPLQKAVLLLAGLGLIGGLLTGSKGLSVASGAGLAAAVLPMLTGGRNFWGQPSGAAGRSHAVGGAAAGLGGAAGQSMTPDAAYDQLLRLPGSQRNEILRQLPAADQEALRQVHARRRTPQAVPAAPATAPGAAAATQPATAPGAAATPLR